MSIPNGVALSLRPAPATKAPNNLGFLLSRIAAERGGFHNVTEESLRAEIAEEEAKAAAIDDRAQHESSSDDDEEEEKLDPEREGHIKREEILMQAVQAENSAYFVTDLISLVLSKYNPVQANASLRPDIRELVGLGTMGVDKMHASRTTEAQKLDTRQVAKAWRCQNLQATVDKIMRAAEKLEEELAAEAVYWEQVRTVSDKGWAVCRLPGERHTMAVRLGFFEAAPAFRNRSLAALRRKHDGGIHLDQGAFSHQSYSIRVRVETDGVMTGETSIPDVVLEGAPIEDFILQARNSIFAEELWQELNREARILASYGIRCEGPTVRCPLTPTQTVIFDLVPLGKISPPPRRKLDYLAESVFLAVNLFLSYAHRQNYRRRCQPPAPLSRLKTQIQPLNLLRPLITRLRHESSIKSLRSLCTSLESVITTIQLPDSLRYSIELSSQSPPTSLPVAEAAILALTNNLSSTLNFTLSPKAGTLVIRSFTSQHAVAETVYFLSLTSESPLNNQCKPPGKTHSIYDVEEYVHFFIACSLALCFEGARVGGLENETAGWHIMPTPNLLRKTWSDGREKQLGFEVYSSDRERDADMIRARDGVAKRVKLSTGPEESKRVVIEAKWEWMGGATEVNPNTGIKRESNLDAKGRKLLRGEGRYRWISRTAADGGDAELAVVEKGIQQVVAEAGLGEQ